MIGWLMMALSVTAAVLMMSKQASSRKVRLIGSGVWVVTNMYWALCAVTTALQAQFAIYLLLALWGVWNNHRDWGQTCKSVADTK